MKWRGRVSGFLAMGELFAIPGGRGDFRRWCPRVAAAGTATSFHAGEQAAAVQHGLRRTGRHLSTLWDPEIYTKALPFSFMQSILFLLEFEVQISASFASSESNPCPGGLFLSLIFIMVFSFPASRAHCNGAGSKNRQRFSPTTPLNISSH